jgi:hypothetical protein
MNTTDICNILILQHDSPFQFLSLCFAFPCLTQSIFFLDHIQTQTHIQTHTLPSVPDPKTPRNTKNKILCKLEMVMLLKAGPILKAPPSEIQR